MMSTSTLVYAKFLLILDNDPLSRTALHNVEPGHDTVIEAYRVATLVRVNTMEKEQSY